MSSKITDKMQYTKRYHTEDNGAELLPPNSKRLCIEDGCNNNLNSALSSTTKKHGSWSCPEESSLVEPEILEDMGVSMLDDEEASNQSLKTTQSKEHSASPTCSNGIMLALNEHENFDVDPDNFRCNYESADSERLLLNGDHFQADEPEHFGTNESGYSSRVEGDLCSNSKCNGEDFKPNNSLDQFYLFKRKRKPSVVGEDKFNKLSDEIILMILKWLPKKCLVRSMLVCKRWYQIARDEALWGRLDLGGKILNHGSLGHILSRGAQILRLAQTEIKQPIFALESEASSESYTSKLQFLDLSMAVISPDDLATLLSRCLLLKKLSLEKCTVNLRCCQMISNNKDIEVLNLTMCEGMDIECVKEIVKLNSLNALNMAWCELNKESMQLLCQSLPPSVTRLNISGCRKTMIDKFIVHLLKSCPNLVELDLSDCSLLTKVSLTEIQTLKKLEHLSVNRCYGLKSEDILRVAIMPSVLFINVFGLLHDNTKKSIETASGKELNKFMYSSVARPTVGVRRTSIWNHKVRD